MLGTIIWIATGLMIYERRKERSNSSGVLYTIAFWPILIYDDCTKGWWLVVIMGSREIYYPGFFAKIYTHLMERSGS